MPLISTVHHALSDRIRIGDLKVNSSSPSKGMMYRTTLPIQHGDEVDHNNFDIMIKLSGI